MMMVCSLDHSTRRGSSPRSVGVSQPQYRSRDRARKFRSPRGHEAVLLSTILFAASVASSAPRFIKVKGAGVKEADGTYELDGDSHHRINLYNQIEPLHGFGICQTTDTSPTAGWLGLWSKEETSFVWRIWRSRRRTDPPECLYKAVTPKLALPSTRERLWHVWANSLVPEKDDPAPKLNALTLTPEQLAELALRRELARNTNYELPPQAYCGWLGRLMPDAPAKGKDDEKVSVQQ